MEPVYSKWWLPIQASNYAADVDSIITVIHFFMFALFIGWGIFFVYCLFKFRERPGHKAHYSDVSGGISKAVEVGVVIFEVVLLVGFSMPVWARVKNEFPSAAESTVCRVVAKRFEWLIHYPGADGKFGRTDPKLIADDNLLGLDRSDPDAKDDVTPGANNFRVPLDRPVIVHLSSRDVIHSFKVPVWRFTQDAIPGVSIPIWFKATKTGQYDIACAQLCGNGHTRMRATATVMPQAEFDEWLRKEGEKLKK